MLNFRILFDEQPVQKEMIDFLGSEFKTHYQVTKTKHTDIDGHGYVSLPNFEAMEKLHVFIDEYFESRNDVNIRDSRLEISLKGRPVINYKIIRYSRRSERERTREQSCGRKEFWPR